MTPCSGTCALVAQLDRALDYESRGREFESSRARHFQISTSQSTRHFEGKDFLAVKHWFPCGIEYAGKRAVRATVYGYCLLRVCKQGADNSVREFHLWTESHCFISLAAVWSSTPAGAAQRRRAACLAARLALSRTPDPLSLRPFQELTRGEGSWRAGCAALGTCPHCLNKSLAANLWLVALSRTGQPVPLILEAV